MFLHNFRHTIVCGCIKGHFLIFDPLHFQELQVEFSYHKFIYPILFVIVGLDMTNLTYKPSE